MRRLTLKGFLDAYVAYLSGEDTLDPKRLAAAARGRSRLSAPLLLWAVETGRLDQFRCLFADEPRYLRELEQLEALRESGRLEWALVSPASPLRPEYAKAWDSYVARRDAHERDVDLKLAARERALALEAQKKVTRYRLAKDLGLNPGNLHSFLSQGDTRHVSRKSALAVVKYLEAV
jgi:hypothetical protein